MRDFLMQWLPTPIIVYMARKMEKLTEKELQAQAAYSDALRAKMRRTKKPVALAMVGLVGSGKSAVAQYLADLIGATVVSGDDIRIALRKQGLSYDKARLIGENVAASIISQGRNVILDSDFVDKNKRASIKQALKTSKPELPGVAQARKLFFVRTICDLDVMSQRIRKNDPGEFFNCASSKSTAEDSGKDVKYREMIRRLPQHYRWVNKSGGGKWILKKMSFVTATVDTTSDDWRKEIASVLINIIY